MSKFKNILKEKEEVIEKVCDDRVLQNIEKKLDNFLVLEKHIFEKDELIEKLTKQIESMEIRISSLEANMKERR